MIIIAVLSFTFSLESYLYKMQLKLSIMHYRKPDQSVIIKTFMQKIVVIT